MENVSCVIVERTVSPENPRLFSGRAVSVILEFQMTLKRSRMRNFCTYYCEQCSVSGLFSVALLRLTKTRWKDGLAFVTSVRRRSVRANRKKGTTSKEHAQKRLSALHK